MRVCSRTLTYSLQIQNDEPKAPKSLLHTRARIPHVICSSIKMFTSSHRSIIVNESGKNGTWFKTFFIIRTSRSVKVYDFCLFWIYWMRWLNYYFILTNILIYLTFKNWNRKMNSVNPNKFSFWSKFIFLSKNCCSLQFACMWVRLRCNFKGNYRLTWNLKKSAFKRWSGGLNCNPIYHTTRATWSVKTDDFNGLQLCVLKAVKKTFLTKSRKQKLFYHVIMILVILIT